MKDFKPSIKSPFLVYVLSFLSFGMYCLIWFQYLFETVNYINEKPVINFEKLKKNGLRFIILYLFIFIFFIVLGPISFSEISPLFGNLLTIIFFFGFSLAVMWNVTVFSLLIFLAYKTDKISNEKYGDDSNPLVSAILAFLSIFFFFTLIPFIQFKLNQLVRRYNQEKAIKASDVPKMSFSQKIKNAKLSPIMLVFVVLCVVLLLELFLSEDYQPPQKFFKLQDQASYHMQHLNFTKAEFYANEALKVIEDKFGREHAHVATSLFFLARVYQANKKYEEAEMLYTRALSFIDRVYDPDNDIKADLLEIAAIFYKKRGKNDLANHYFNLALVPRLDLLKKLERKYGQDDPDLILTLIRLGNTLYHQEKFSEAKKLFERSIKIGKVYLSKSDDATLRDYEDVAEAYFKLRKCLVYQNNITQVMRNFKDELTLENKIISILKKELGNEHHGLSDPYATIGDLYLDNDNISEAEKSLKKALVLNEKKGTLWYLKKRVGILSNLIKVYEKLNNMEELKVIKDKLARLDFITN